MKNGQKQSSSLYTFFLSGQTLIENDVFVYNKAVSWVIPYFWT